MPKYLKMREKHSLWELFHTPDLVTQITLLPIDDLDVDAAILFSDILVIAEAFGRRVDFVENKGPVIDRPLVSPSDVENLTLTDLNPVFSYIKHSIFNLKKELKVPLIGFCGGPFTVASYMIETESKGDLKKTKQWMYSDPQSFHSLLQKLTDASIAYLKLQIDAGVQAVQIFDSWANVLPFPHFAEFCLKYNQQIISALQALEIPVIFFSRGSSLFPEEIASMQPRAISFDWQKEMKDLRQKVPSNIAVQGNLDPLLLKAPKSVIQKNVNHLLNSMRGEPGFIVNLGHGVLPDIPLENVLFFVELVKNFS